MPYRQIVIDFECAQDEQLVSEQTLVARVRALGEDLFRKFSRNGHAIINIHDVDAAINQLSLTLSSNHHMGSVLRFINKQLVRHKLADIAHVSKLEPSSALKQRENSKQATTGHWMQGT
jgi:hypothetical protein